MMVRNGIIADVKGEGSYSSRSLEEWNPQLIAEESLSKHYLLMCGRTGLLSFFRRKKKENSKFKKDFMCERVFTFRNEKDGERAKD